MSQQYKLQTKEIAGVDIVYVMYGEKMILIHPFISQHYKTQPNFSVAVETTRGGKIILAEK